VSQTSKLVSLLFFISISCHKKDNCDYTSHTESFGEIEDFQKIPIEGVYKVNTTLSTDLTFESEELSNSTLYVTLRSTDQDDKSHGFFFFHQFPAWDDSSGMNQMNDFYGGWRIVGIPSLFDKNFFFDTSFLLPDEDAAPKSIVARNDIRLKNGKPIIVARVIKSLDLKSDYGYSHLYLDPSSKYYCNYLVYEKISDKVDEGMAREIQKIYLEHTKTSSGAN